MLSRPRTRAIVAPVFLALVSGCSPTASTSAPPPIVSDSPPPAIETSSRPSPGASPTAPPGAEIRAFPARAGVDLEPGTFLSTPPFDITFTFEVVEPGWESGHLLGEFFDILRFEGRPNPGTPAVSLAFGHPTSIEGSTEAIEELSPDEAAAALAGRADLVVGATTPFTLDGRGGIRIDIHADRPDTTLFRGPHGALGVGPTQDTRLGFVPLENDLLLVLVMADPDDLDTAWERAQPILESVHL